MPDEAQQFPLYTLIVSRAAGRMGRRGSNGFFIRLAIVMHATPVSRTRYCAKSCASSTEHQPKRIARPCVPPAGTKRP